MKKYLIAVFALLLLMFSFHLDGGSAQRQDYEKYGRIAIAVIKEDFPGEEVRDYQYMGRKQNSIDEVTDSFQFKITSNGKPILATVQISHNLKNNKLLSLTVTEQPQQ